MKLKIVLPVLMTLASLQAAAKSPIPKFSEARAIVNLARNAVLALTEEKLKKIAESSSPLKNVRVEFDSMACLDAVPNELDEGVTGICVAEAGAWQMAGSIAIL